VIAQHQDTAGPQQAAQERGVYGVGYNADMSRQAPEATLTSPIWHWGVFYTQTVQQVLDGTLSEKGVLAPMTPKINNPIMKELKEKYGVEMKEKTIV